MIVVLEGHPGSGKTRLINEIRKPEINIITEFGNGRLGNLIKNNLETQGCVTDDPVLETYLFFLNLLQKQGQVKPSAINVMDTYLDSIRNHQQIRLGLERYNAIQKEFESAILKPDLVLYLGTPKSVMFERLAKRGSLESEEERAFFSQVWENYSDCPVVPYEQASKILGRYCK